MTTPCYRYIGRVTITRHRERTWRYLVVDEANGSKPVYYGHSKADALRWIDAHTKKGGKVA